MTIQVQETEYCKLQINYSADSMLVSKKRDEALKSIKKNKLKVPGFRPGKAPDHVLKLNFKKAIDEFVTSSLTDEAFQDALFETKAKVFGNPVIQQLNLNGNQFWCTLSLLKRPEFELKEYKNLEIPKPHLNETSEQLTQKQLQDLREVHAKNTPFTENDVVGFGDKIILSYKFVFENQELAPLEQDHVLYSVGQGVFPELDEQLVGMKANQNKQFVLTFGEQAPQQLQGQKANVDVTMHMGLKIELAALDDELAKKSGFKSFDDLYKTINTMSENQLKIQINNELFKQLAAKLIDLHDFQVPEWLVQAEIVQLEKNQKFTFNELTVEEQKSIQEHAQRSVKLALIIEEIKDKETGVSFSDQEVIAVVRRYVASRFNLNHLTDEDLMKNSKINSYLAEAVRQGTLSQLMASVRSEAALNWLLNQSKILE